jgi:hypothetical protein
LAVDVASATAGRLALVRRRRVAVPAAPSPVVAVAAVAVVAAVGLVGFVGVVRWAAPALALVLSDVRSARAARRDDVAATGLGAVGRLRPRRGAGRACACVSSGGVAAARLARRRVPFFVALRRAPWGLGA